MAPFELAERYTSASRPGTLRMAQTQGQQQRYRVIDRLAAGGMAEVFRAESAGIEGFKKKVAIKRVLPHLSEKQKFIKMFLDEARLSAHLCHSNVVQVFDIGMGDKAYFIVMEFVDGADLKAIIETRRKLNRDFPLEEAVYIATKMCEGLAYAHELTDNDSNPLGIVHRDMSPPNVLITKFGEVKIADFGLAKASNQLEKSEPGIIKGKFSYLSPEAALGQEVDLRTDIFAVGIILWEMLAGRKLFLGESDFQTVKLVQAANVTPASHYNPRVPPELDRVIAKALAKDPSDRYLRTRDLAKDLTSFLFHHGKPVGPWDIASLVAEAVYQKQREKPQNVSIIGKLITEALFEFTSLKQEHDEADGSGGKSGAGKTPRNTPNKPLDLGQGHDWAAEIFIKNPYDNAQVPQQSVAPNLPSLSDLEAGNLSMLEDDAPEPSSQNPPSPTPPARALNTPSSEGPLTPEPPSAAVDSLPQPMPRPEAAKGKSWLMILIFVLLILAAAAAGAWYAKSFPG
jgi:serine/threonine-protein kinase